MTGGVLPVLLSIEGLSKRFGAVLATDNVSLELRAGEVHGLIGPNGAGKTSLIGQISGSVAPDSGVIRFDGVDITRLPQHQRVRLGLVRSFQITRLFKGFSALENLAVAVQARSGSSLSFWRPVASEPGLREEAFQLLTDLGLASRADTRADQLSHGEQRTLEVGLGLATRPRLLLLDEPMAGSGPDESERLCQLIERIRSRVSILLIEHDVDAVFRLADRVSVLVYGRIVATGHPDAVRSDPDVIAAYLGDEQRGEQGDKQGDKQGGHESA